MRKIPSNDDETNQHPKKDAPLYMYIFSRSFYHRRRRRSVVTLCSARLSKAQQQLLSAKGMFSYGRKSTFWVHVVVGRLQVNCRLFLRMLKWWSVSSELSDGAPPRKLHFTSFTSIQNDDKEEKNVYTEKSLIGETAIVS